MKMIKNALLYAGVISICAMLIVNADTSVNAAAEAVKRCLNIIIPSLFVFMAASGILIRSEAYKVLAKPFLPLSRYVFKMPDELFSVFLISNLAGFPIGAAMLCELVDSGRISKRTASIMQCVCYGGGPSFSLGVIGLYIYSDKRIGIIICLSSFIANLTAAFVLCRLFRPNISESSKAKPFSADDITACTENAGRSILMISALIIIFSVVMADTQRLAGEYIHIHPQAKVLIKTIFELSSITGLEKARTGFIPVIAALFSFGGVCVLMQISATVRGRYPLTPFFAARLPISAVSYFTAAGLYHRVLGDAEICIAARKDFIVNFNNFIPSICLVLMIFLLLFQKGVAFFHDV